MRKPSAVRNPLPSGGGVVKLQDLSDGSLRQLEPSCFVQGISRAEAERVDLYRTLTTQEKTTRIRYSWRWSARELSSDMDSCEPAS